jgi:hypothetical protein
MNHTRISRVRRGVRVLAIASGVLVAGCLRSTAPQPSVIQLNGTWKYTGVQIQPVRETLTGTLKISRESGASFQGELVLLAINEANGEGTSLNGLVSGTESEGNVIDFDADLETVRRHVGQMVGDTITGTWIGSASNGIMSSGTFKVERETQ